MTRNRYLQTSTLSAPISTDDIEHKACLSVVDALKMFNDKKHRRGIIRILQESHGLAGRVSPKNRRWQP